MQVVTGRTYRHTPARIHGFERFMLKGRVYPGITETGSGETDGRVYFDLDEDALARLDFFEADEYDRACLRVELADELDDEATTEAYVYVIPRGRADLLSDERWDEARFVSERLDGFLGDTRRWMAGFLGANQ